MGTGSWNPTARWTCHRNLHRNMKNPLTTSTWPSRTSPRLGVIFDTISIKARWERWCRWNCDLKVINAWKKAFSVLPKASPRRPNHVTICLLRHSGESLQNGQLELWRCNRYFARETHKDIAISVWACLAGFRKSIGIPWGLWNRTHWSAHYSNGCDAVQQESQLVWIVSI